MANGDGFRIFYFIDWVVILFSFSFTFVAMKNYSVLRMCYANEGLCGRAGSKGSGKRVEHGAEKGWITSKK